MPESTHDRESLGDLPNPLGLLGLEYIEYTTGQPQALGQVLETLGFRPVARHRSREVLLYRQGSMNLVVNAHPGVVKGTAARDDTAPRITAVALRVRDARHAVEHAVGLGAWEVPNHAQAMELNIPGIHGPGGAHIFFVDRTDDFSIFDIDFRPIPGVDAHPPALVPMHVFGIVQYIGTDRTDDWLDFYGRLMGFVRLPDQTRFGILPKGCVLQSPGEVAERLYLQLIEPDPAVAAEDEQERFQRIGFGVADVPAAVAQLRQRGLGFVDAGPAQASAQGAVTRSVLGGVVFEFVRDARGA